MIFGREGLFLATIKGTGIVLLQSLPFSRMANPIIARAPSADGDRKKDGQDWASYAAYWIGGSDRQQGDCNHGSGVVAL